MGVKLSGKERAALQEGKAVELKVAKQDGSGTISQWAKLNERGNNINYFNKNPDQKQGVTNDDLKKTSSRKVS